MGLLCSLRGHEADWSKIVWNGGICFGTCVRCGTDLVRTIRDRWQVPRGYKVVWRAAPKEEPQPIAAEAAGWSEPDLAEPVDFEVAEPELAFEADLEAEAHIIEEPALKEAEAVIAAEEIEVAVPETLEWPLSLTAPDAEVELLYPDALTEPAYAAEKPAADLAALPDFMEDWADDMDWDDFPDHRQRIAAG